MAGKTPCRYRGSTSTEQCNSIGSAVSNSSCVPNPGPARTGLIIPRGFFGFPVFLCLGTTECSWYDRMCNDPSVPNKASYCNAKSLCASFGNSPAQKCVRLCLESQNQCWRLPAGIRFELCKLLFQSCLLFLK